MSDNFNISNWRISYLNENDLEGNKLSQLISQSIKNVDENLSYEDLAIAIANILKDEYGSHNYEPFIKTLRNNLNI